MEDACQFVVFAVAVVIEGLEGAFLGADYVKKFLRLLEVNRLFSPVHGLVKHGGVVLGYWTSIGGRGCKASALWLCPVWARQQSSFPFARQTRVRVVLRGQLAPGRTLLFRGGAAPPHCESRSRLLSGRQQCSSAPFRCRWRHWKASGADRGHPLVACASGRH